MAVTALVTGGWRAAAVLLVLPLIGCGDAGPTTMPVKGTVSYRGKPLPLGIVMLVPSDGPAASATIGSDGAYQLEAVPGKHRVAVIAMPPRQGRPDPNVEGGLDTTGFPEPKSLIPEKYNRYDTSGIEIEVKESSENTLDINLP